MRWQLKSIIGGTSLQDLGALNALVTLGRLTLWGRKVAAIHLSLRENEDLGTVLNGTTYHCCVGDIGRYRAGGNTGPSRNIRKGGACA